MESRRRWLGEEADQLAAEALREVRQAVGEGLRFLAGAPGPFGSKAEELLGVLERVLESSPVTRRRLDYAARLRKGDIVYVPRYRRRCVVDRVDRERRVFHVTMGGLKAQIGFEDVSWVQPLDVET